MSRPLPGLLAIAAVGFGLASTWSAPAAAQPRAERDAENIAAEGAMLLGEEMYQEAAPLLLQAYRLAPVPRYLFGAARAYESGRSAADATNVYLLYLRRHPREENAEDCRRGITRLRRAALRTHGEVIVESTPSGATVTLADRGSAPIGETPMTIWLPAGTVRIQVRFGATQPIVQDVRVERGATARVNAAQRDEPTPGRGTLRLASVPMGAQVTINDQPVPFAHSRASKDYVLRAGRYRVVVVHPTKGRFVQEAVVPESGVVVVDLGHQPPRLGNDARTNLTAR